MCSATVRGEGKQLIHIADYAAAPSFCQQGDPIFFQPNVVEPLQNWRKHRLAFLPEKVDCPLQALWRAGQNWLTGVTAS